MLPPIPADQVSPFGPGVLVEYADFATLKATTSISRSRAYRLAAEGKIELRSMGGRTVAVMATVREYLSKLPQAGQPARSAALRELRQDALKRGVGARGPRRRAPASANRASSLQHNP